MNKLVLISLTLLTIQNDFCSKKTAEDFGIEFQLGSDDQVMELFEIAISDLRK